MKIIPSTNVAFVINDSELQISALGFQYQISFLQKMEFGYISRNAWVLQCITEFYVKFDQQPVKAIHTNKKIKNYIKVVC